MSRPCRTCGLPRDRHGTVIEYPPGRREWFPPDGFAIGPFRPDRRVACMEFEPKPLVDGVL